MSEITRGHWNAELRRMQEAGVEPTVEGEGMRRLAAERRLTTVSASLSAAESSLSVALGELESVKAGLKTLEFLSVNGLEGKYCPVCGDRETHSEKCWLPALLPRRPTPSSARARYIEAGMALAEADIAFAKAGEGGEGARLKPQFLEVIKARGTYRSAKEALAAEDGK